MLVVMRNKEYSNSDNGDDEKIMRRDIMNVYYDEGKNDHDDDGDGDDDDYDDSNDDDHDHGGIFTSEYPPHYIDIGVLSIKNPCLVQQN